jgi:hypothetical protein
MQESEKPVHCWTGCRKLFDFTWPLFAVALAGQCFLGAALFAWFQIKRMPLDLFDDVFLLHFALEAS